MRLHLLFAFKNQSFVKIAIFGVKIAMNIP